MNWQMTEAWRLAEELELMRARSIARTSRLKVDWRGLYDPHAATELASLIYNRMTTPPSKRKKASNEDRR